MTSPELQIDSATLQATPKAQTPAALAKGDKHIWGIYILLCLISIIELYSASSREVAMNSSFGVLGPVVRHVGILFAGFIVLWFVQSRHYTWILKWSGVFVLLSVGLMIYVLFFGDIINGARRSTSFFGFQLAPAEFIKMSAVLVVSFIMARSQLSKEVGVSDRGVWTSAVLTLLLGCLLIKNGGTNTLLLMAIALSMMLIGGAKIVRQWFLVVGVYLLLGAAYVGVQMLVPESAPEPVEEMQVQPDGTVKTVMVIPEQKSGGRVDTWIARFQRFFTGDSIPKYAQPIDAKNRQEMYAYMAQANGGVWGVFPGNSRETARLPLAFSDFIYSIVIEDTGLLGGAVVLVLYLWLLGRAAGIASRCNRAYPALLVIGMAVMIAFQALIHMAIVTGAAPVSGQPLPLISKGGSSIIVTSIAFGVMLSVSKYAAGVNSKRQHIKTEIEALPEEMRGANPTQL